MRFHSATTLAVAILLITGPEASHAAQTTSGAEVDAVIAAMDEVGDALRTGDNEAFLAMYTPDVFFMPPDSAPAIGKDALAAANPLEGPIPWEEVYEEVMVHGDWAHVIGAWTVGGSEAGKAIYILARQGDGTWKIAREFWNADGSSGEGQ